LSLHQINVIDAIGLDETSGRVHLVIHHDDPWDGSDAQLYLLQEKLNAYLSFALDGEMADSSPEFADRPVAVVIQTPTSPDPRTLHLLTLVRKQIEFQDITLAVRISPDCSHGCHCH
jgi:hypothetical protein